MPSVKSPNKFKRALKFGGKTSKNLMPLFNQNTEMKEVLMEPEAEKKAEPMPSISLHEEMSLLRKVFNLIDHYKTHGTAVQNVLRKARPRITSPREDTLIVCVAKKTQVKAPTRLKIKFFRLMTRETSRQD
ncbi:hypothetical protein evm_013187 [Chilo suppressalis]|nr:hypothetical protein evm_013187 [Chilo suppressalis]